MLGSKLTSRGQTTIPKEVRKHLGLEPGDRVMFIVKDNMVVLQPVKQTLLDLRGSVEPRRRPESYSEVRREVKKQITESRVDD